MISMKDDDKGMTMIEVIAVLVIMGFLAYTVGSRLGEDVYDETVWAETLISHIRYAQSQAMGSDLIWGIELVSPETYSLYNIIQGDTLQTYVL